MLNAGISPKDDGISNKESQMETFETLLKLIGLLIFYGLLVLFGTSIFIFVMVIVAVRYVFSLFGREKFIEEDRGEIEEPNAQPGVYAHETTILYKKEEYQALVMYYVENWSAGPVYEIVSVASQTEDFTDLLPESELARLRVEIEYSHVD